MRVEGPDRNGKAGEMGEGRPVFTQAPVWLVPVWLSDVARLAWVICVGWFLFFMVK